MIALILLGLLLVAVFLIVRHFRQRTNTEPVCAQCEYIVHGLPGTTCPECGADLSAPGAVREPGRRKPMHLGILFVIVAIFTACTAIFVTPQIVDRLPAFVSHYERIDLSPASGAFAQISILHLDDGYEPAPIGTIKITIDPPSHVLAIIEVNPKTMMAQYPGNGWQPSARTFTPGVVQTVFATTGINSPAASEEATDIVNGVNALAQRRWFSWGSDWSSVGSTTNTRRYVPSWYWKVCFGGFAAIGLITFTLLARRASKTPSSRYSGERDGERG